jgi:hypothetical protein
MALLHFSFLCCGIFLRSLGGLALFMVPWQHEYDTEGIFCLKDLVFGAACHENKILADCGIDRGGIAIDGDRSCRTTVPLHQ